MADSKLTADDLLLDTPVAGYGPATQPTSNGQHLAMALLNAVSGLKQNVVDPNVDLLKGISSGAASTAYGANRLASTGLQDLGIPVPNFYDTAIGKFLIPNVQSAMQAPESFGGQVGRGLERAGEFALGGELAAPVSAALKARMALPAVKAASGVLPRMVSAIPSAIAQGGMAGAVGAMQEGEPSGGILPASVGALGSLVAPMLSTFVKAKAAKPVFDALESEPISNVPVTDTSNVQKVLSKADALEKVGASPKNTQYNALHDLVKNPQQNPTIGELRQAISNLPSTISELSKSFPGAKPTTLNQIQRHVTEVRQAVNSAIYNHIPDLALQDQFAQALENYASKEAVKRDLKKVAAIVGPAAKTALGGFAGYKTIWPYIKKKIFE